MFEKGKFLILYKDPHQQVEHFQNIEDASKRFDELADTPVEELMFALLLEEKLLEEKKQVED